MKWIYSISFILLLNAPLRAQPMEPYTIYSYGVNEGLLQSTISDIGVDADNFLWVGFPNGLQRYDGVNFNIVPVQPGLPDDKGIHFFKTSSGDFLLAHSYGISRYRANANKFELIYKNEAAAKHIPLYIGENKNVLYFWTDDAVITGLSTINYKIIGSAKTGITVSAPDSNGITKFSNNIVEDRVGIISNNQLYQWHLTEQKLQGKSTRVDDQLNKFLFLKNNAEILYCSYKKNPPLNCYNFNTGIQKPQHSRVFPIINRNRCIFYQWGNRKLLAFNNRIFETDSLFNQKIKELVSFQYEPAGSNYSIAKITEDNYGNLWLQTVTGGLKKINRKHYPLKNYNSAIKDESNIMSLLPDKAANRVLAGTVNNGLLVFDTLQQLVKHIKSLPGQLRSFTVNAIAKNEDGSYLLFINSQKKIWILSANLAKLSGIPIQPNQQGEEAGLYYFGKVIYQYQNTTVAQTQGRLYKVTPDAGRAKEYLYSNAYIMSGILTGNTILTHGNDELLYIDTASLAIVQKIPFPNTGYIRCFAKGRGDTIYAGSNKGIFCINGKGQTLYQLDKKAGLPDECIYGIAALEDGTLWCSSNKGLFRIQNRQQNLHLKKSDGLQESEFNTNAVAVSADGEVFFGGVNGITSFYPGQIKAPADALKIILTSIQYNNRELFADTAASAINAIRLPYDKNSLSFAFTLMGPSPSADYTCQYKMKGIDKSWLTAATMQTVHYFLPPGRYTLQIAAGNSFNADAMPLKELEIYIAPPFWKTGWFTGAIILALIGIAITTANSYNKRKYQKKLVLLMAEQKIQTERERISRDLHDSIGAYANAILYNTELLQKENTTQSTALLSHLRYASKDIITALRDTVWALKKNEYTAEECLLRIRNFTQPFNRYYSPLQFTVEGEAPEQLVLHYTDALNTLRIIQEAVTNAIKHANASKVSIQSCIENNNWKLCVADDGKGFDPENTRQEQPGNGLQNMESRAAASGFAYSLVSEKNKGTRVCISIPVKL
ncbi:MAG TPA: histidine kinase [Ferruginibacter sp.]|nr:histidine kinase [Ferruginibacter sp.]HMP20837.1 histidine kinase [Ferruginibacter sp.]